MEKIKSEIENQIEESNAILKKVSSKIVIEKLLSADFDELTSIMKRVSKLCRIYQIIAIVLMVLIIPFLFLNFFKFENSLDFDKILILVIMLSLFSLYKYLRHRILLITLNRKIGLIKILKMANLKDN